MPLDDPDATVTELRTSTELRSEAAQIMKTVKATHREIEALNEAAQQNGKLDKAALDQALDRILKAAREINREVTDLLAKTRR